MSNNENTKKQIRFLILGNIRLKSIKFEREKLMKRRQGFTLLELMIVVVILGVLALIAVPVLLNAVEQSRESAVMGNVSAASSTVSSRVAIGSTIATSGGGTNDVVTLLNASSENPYGAGVSFVGGACANEGEVGILDNGDGSFTINGCGSGGAEVTTKTIYEPEDVAGINL